MKGLWVGDSEASGLLTEPNLYYHCVLFKEYAKNNWYLFLDPNREGFEDAVRWYKTKHSDKNITLLDINKDFVTWLTTTPKAIAVHNMFGYDLPLWQKLSGIHFDMFRDPKCMGTINDKQVNLYDTLSMSRTLWPDRPLPKGCPESVKNPVTGRLELVAPHGLMAWGYRVANKKVKIDDWRNQPLWEYCNRIVEDVIINELVWKELMDEMQCKGKFEDTAKFLYKDTPYGKQHKINWKNALRRGMLADYLMLLQERQGVWFDTEAAEKLCARIDTMMKEIEDEVEPLLPPKPMSESQRPKFPSRPFNRDGSISSTGYKWLKKLGYPVDFSAFDYVAPPAKPFTSTGGLSAAGARWCLNEFGIEDPEKAREFLSEYAQKPAPQPLPDDLMEKAKKDLHDQKEPDFLVPMKLSNQDDIKRYLVNTAGWKPTMWRTKDVTKDSFKKERKDDVIHTYVESYLDDLDQSEYKYLILEYLRSTNEDFQITNRVYDGRKENETREKKVFAAFRRLARALPTSPMLKDTFGHLCPNLEKIDADTAKKIVKWLSLRNRRGVLRPMNEKEGESKGWLNHPRLAVDHKLPAGSSGITNTGRRKHCVVCNVPKPSEKVLLGKEMRGLLGVDTTKYYEVGIDGSNLEQLIGAWGAFEFDNGLYYHTVTKGDAHCYSGDTQILTENGWEYFENLQDGTMVFQYHHDNRTMSLVEPEVYIRKDFTGSMYHIYNSGVDFLVTDKHRMLTEDERYRKNELLCTLAGDLKVGKVKGTNSSRRFIHGAEFYGDKHLSQAEINLIIAVHDDGNVIENRNGFVCRVELAKKRKIEKLLQTLNNLQIPYSEQKGKITKGGLLTKRFQFEIPSFVFEFIDSNKDFEYSLMRLDKESKNAFVMSLPERDGWVSTTPGVFFYSQADCRRKSVEVVAALATQCGLRNNTVLIDKPGHAVQHRVTVGSKMKAGLLSLKKDKIEVKDFKVYCVTVPTGAIIVRRNGKTAICGNCENAKAYSKAAGREVSRGDGKPITYGVLYGAQAPKVASMLDVPREIGQKVIDALWDANPGLKGRKEALEAFWEATGRKFIYGLDGRKLYARSRHSLLNLFQQNGGALLCDLVGILMHYQLIKRGWYDLGVRRIIYYHDEYQLQVPLSFRKFYYFDTIEALEAFKAEQEAKGVIFDGHKYKKERRDENDEKMVDKDGNQLYDPILNEDGKLTLVYCPVGEMVVKCFWQASKMLGVPFQITGEYLTGESWGSCH